MKVAGIIAEYNPFHNGHSYHIEQTRALTDADYVIAVISGQFVQRGAPALADQFVRAGAALENGVDLVLSLPAVGSVSGAGDFARSGVNILAKLGVVTDLSFGCEASAPSEKDYLRRAAGFLSEETPAFQRIFREYLGTGLSWPAARTKALSESLEDDLIPAEDAVRLLSSPNNILALEYLKTLYTDAPGIAACMITRQGDAYHSAHASDHALASATSLRKCLLSGQDCTDYMPASAARSLFAYQTDHRFLSEDVFSDLLFGILCRERTSLPKRFTRQPELAATILHEMEHFTGWKDFVLRCKGKNMPYTSVSRYLTQILLGIDTALIQAADQCDFAPYARILGFRKSAAPLLSAIRGNASLPVITSPAKALRELSGHTRRLLDTDLSAGELYRYHSQLSGNLSRSELRQPLVYL